MEWRTATGKVLLALAGIVGAALVVFVVAPWLQAPAPPVSPDEIIQEVTGPGGEDEVEATGEADEVAGALPEIDETILPAPGPVAQPVEEGGEDREVVGELPAPLTPDEVASAMLAPSAPGEGGGDEVAAGEAFESAVNRFAAAVLEKLDEMVDAEARPPDAVVASAPSVDEDEDETVSPEPEQVDEPVPAETATAGEAVERQVEPPLEVVKNAPYVASVAIERNTRVEFSRPALGPLETLADEGAQRPFVLPAAGLAELRRPESVTAPRGTRGVMGYRMPLVSRQALPIQVVSGVVMPAHHTYVILRPGHWELLMEGGEAVVSAEPVEAAIEEPPPRSCWKLWNLFRKRTPAGEK